MTATHLLLHFDNSLADTSGQNNTVICGVSCPAYAPTGKIGNAYSFSSASSTSLVITTPVGLDFDAGASFSVMLWVNTTTPNTEIMLAKHPVSPAQGYLLYLSNGIPILYLNGNSRAQGPAVNDGLWHLIVATLDRTSTSATLYVDGKLAQSLSFPLSVANSAEFDIGWWNNPVYTYSFDGQLDEIAVFARALSAAEVEKIYQYQLPLFRSGYFTSRAMDAFNPPAGWNQLSWLPQRPTGKELPNYGLAESGYVTGNVDMTGTLLLMHLDEPPGSALFADTSGASNSGTCSGAYCPTAGVSGKLNTGVFFNSSKFINVFNQRDVPPPWTAEFWVYRQNSLNPSAILLDSPWASLRLQQFCRDKRGRRQRCLRGRDDQFGSGQHHLAQHLRQQWGVQSAALHCVQFRFNLARRCEDTLHHDTRRECQSECARANCELGRGGGAAV